MYDQKSSKKYTKKFSNSSSEHFNEPTFSEKSSKSSSQISDENSGLNLNLNGQVSSVYSADTVASPDSPKGENLKKRKRKLDSAKSESKPKKRKSSHSRHKYRDDEDVISFGDDEEEIYNPRPGRWVRGIQYRWIDFAKHTEESVFVWAQLFEIQSIA